MKKTILTYGLISGAIASVIMVWSAWTNKGTMDFENGMVYGYISIFLSMMFIFLGVRSYRDKVLDGFISFGKAFQVGILICIISCVCYVVTWLFVFEYMEPDFMDKYVAHTLESMQQSGASTEKIAAESQKMEDFKEMYKNPFVRFAFTFIEPFPVGVLVTLISAAVLRKNAA